MKLITKQLKNDHNIFFYGDLHEGSVLFSEKSWNKFINMIGSEYDGCSNNYAFDTGDMIEAIMVDDKRFSVEKLTEPLPQEQANKAIERREPIKAQLLAILLGNHERKLWRFGNITEDACQKLGVSYGTYTAKVAIHDVNEGLMYKIYATHGFRSIRSTADDPIRRLSNELLQLKRHLKFKAGDCAVMIKGHTHKLRVAKPSLELYLTDDGKKIKQHYTEWGQNESYIHPDARWYGNTGSFLKLFGDGISGYAEIFEYDPTEMGFLILKVRNKKIVSLDPIMLGL